MSSSAGSALKLKVSLYTGLAEPSTAEVFLHLTNLLWFIRDTLTSTPGGQCRPRARRGEQGPSLQPVGGPAGRAHAPPGRQDPITHSCCSQRALQEETGLISVLPAAEEMLSSLSLLSSLSPERTHGWAGLCSWNLAPHPHPSPQGAGPACRVLGPPGAPKHLLLQRPSLLGGGLDGFWLRSGGRNASSLIVSQRQRRTLCGWGGSQWGGTCGVPPAPRLQLSDQLCTQGCPRHPQLPGQGGSGPLPGGTGTFAEGQGRSQAAPQGAKTPLCEKGGANLVSGVLGVLMEAKEMQPWDSHKEAASHATAVQRGRAWLGRQ